MIAPTIPEQIEALRLSAANERNGWNSPIRPTIESLRRAEVLDFIRNRIEVFVNKARALRADDDEPRAGDVAITSPPPEPS